MTNVNIANYKSDLIWSATVNLANSIVGVSLLSMPYVLKKAGVILGLACIFICAYFTYISCKYLARSAYALRRRSFQYLVLFTNGVIGKTIVEISIIGLNIGACVAFFVVIGDVAAEFLARYVTPDNLNFYKNIILVILATSIVLPLALVSDIGKFAKLSAFSLAFYSSFVTYVFYAFITSSGPTDMALKSTKYPLVWFNFNGVLEVAPIIAGSFTCQPALFPLMELLEDDTPKSIEYVSKRAITFVAFIYSAVGLFGYFMFGDSCLGDMLHNFERSTATDFFKLAFAFSILCSFPLAVYPLRSSLETLLFQNLTSSSEKRTKQMVSNNRYEKAVETSSSSDEYQTESKIHIETNNNDAQGANFSGGVHIPAHRFIKMTFVIVGFTLTTGILIPHVEKILAFTGSTAGMLISLILPSFVYLQTLPKAPPYKAKLIFVIGILLMLIGTLNVLSSGSNSDPITQLLYEKSLRRPEMFRIDEEIQADFLKQRKLVEEQLAELQKDEENLKLRKEDLAKKMDELQEPPAANGDQPPPQKALNPDGEKQNEGGGTDEKKTDENVPVDNIQQVAPQGKQEGEQLEQPELAHEVDGEKPKERMNVEQETENKQEPLAADTEVKNVPESLNSHVKTDAEEDLLKKLKETQELQEKLMEHQNQLLNKLEDEHEAPAVDTEKHLVAGADAVPVGGGGEVKPDVDVQQKEQPQQQQHQPQQKVESAVVNNNNNADDSSYYKQQQQQPQQKVESAVVNNNNNADDSSYYKQQQQQQKMQIPNNNVNNIGNDDKIAQPQQAVLNDQYLKPSQDNVQLNAKQPAAIVQNQAPIAANPQKVIENQPMNEQVNNPKLNVDVNNPNLPQQQQYQPKPARQKSVKNEPINGKNTKKKNEAPTAVPFSNVKTGVETGQKPFIDGHNDAMLQNREQALNKMNDPNSNKGAAVENPDQHSFLKKRDIEDQMKLMRFGGVGGARFLSKSRK